MEVQNLARVDKHQIYRAILHLNVLAWTGEHNLTWATES